MVEVPLPVVLADDGDSSPSRTTATVAALGWFHAHRSDRGGNMQSNAFNPMAAIGLGAIAAIIVGAALANASLPWLGSGRGPFIALVIVGLVLCGVGMGPFGYRMGWAHPLTIAGILLGITALVVIVAGFANWTAILQPIANIAPGSSSPLAPERTAIIGLGAVMAVKWLISWLQLLPR
jgi:hypothetical protein